VNLVRTQGPRRRARVARARARALTKRGDRAPSNRARPIQAWRGPARRGAHDTVYCIFDDGERSTATVVEALAVEARGRKGHAGGGGRLRPFSYQSPSKPHGAGAQNAHQYCTTGVDAHTVAILEGDAHRSRFYGVRADTTPVRQDQPGRRANDCGDDRGNEDPRVPCNPQERRRCLASSERR
jgi:hypothetical protein